MARRTLPPGRWRSHCGPLSRSSALPRARWSSRAARTARWLSRLSAEVFWGATRRADSASWTASWSSPPRTRAAASPTGSPRATERSAVSPLRRASWRWRRDADPLCRSWSAWPSSSPSCLRWWRQGSRDDAVCDHPAIRRRRHLLVGVLAQHPDLAARDRRRRDRDHAQPARPVRHVDQADRVLRGPRDDVHPLHRLQPVRELPADDAVRGEDRVAARDRGHVSPRRRWSRHRHADALGPGWHRIGAGLDRHTRTRAHLLRASPSRAGVCEWRDRRPRHVRAHPLLGCVDRSDRAAHPRLGRPAEGGGRLAARRLLGARHGGARGRRARSVRGDRRPHLRYGHAPRDRPVAAIRSVDIRHAGAYLAMVPGGITLLGLAAISPLGIAGSVLSLFTGGLAAALIAGVCATVSERAQTRSLLLLSGLAPRMPNIAWIFLLAAFALLGVPVFASFASEVMTFFGAFKTQPIGAFAVAIGLAITAVALAALLGRVLFGSPNSDAPGVSDAALGETWYLGILAGALLWIGLFPGGPKIPGTDTPLFDPGFVSQIAAGVSDITSNYTLPAPAAPAAQ